VGTTHAVNTSISADDPDGNEVEVISPAEGTK
jgi:hypothetical protein